MIHFHLGICCELGSRSLNNKADMSLLSWLAIDLDSISLSSIPTLKPPHFPSPFPKDAFQQQIT